MTQMLPVRVENRRSAGGDVIRDEITALVHPPWPSWLLGM